MEPPRYANFFCYANFSIVFGPNFGGGAKVSEEGGKLPQHPPGHPVEESQRLHLKAKLYNLTGINYCIFSTCEGIQY